MNCMNASLKHLLLAVLMVLFTVTAGPMIPKAQQVNSLAIGTDLGLIPEDPLLEVSLPEQSPSLSFSSQSEVLFFDLDSSGPYTLRYLSVFVDSEGLTLPSKLSDWELYTVEKDRVNYREQVGYAERFEDGFLRLRFYSTPAAGYLGEGKARFALVAPIYKTKEAEEFFHGFSFPIVTPEDFAWEFVAGHHTKPWMDLDSDSILGTDRLHALPSEKVFRQ